MNKVELVRAMATESTLTQKDCELALDALSNVIKSVVMADDKVTIPNIATVLVKTVPERRGKIMLGEKKGQEYVIPEHREPKMKLVKSFKECLL